MARLARLTLPHHPHHIIQRGNNRQAIFHTAADYDLLLALLAEYAAKFSVALHGYVLMTNHFHLLATPDSENGIPQMMQAVGRRYVRYFNQRQARTGTLWEGRYKSTLIQAERHLMACMVYMDLNPVRAVMVNHPGDYPWSSYRHHAGLAHDKLVQPHALYWELGNTPFAREAAYLSMVNAGITERQGVELTQFTLRGWALGEADYVAELQKRTRRRVAKSNPGRPFQPPKK